MENSEAMLCGSVPRTHDQTEAVFIRVTCPQHSQKNLIIPGEGKGGKSDYYATNNFMLLVQTPLAQDLSLSL